MFGQTAINRGSNPLGVIHLGEREELEWSTDFRRSIPPIGVGDSSQFPGDGNGIVSDRCAGLRRGVNTRRGVCDVNLPPSPPKQTDRASSVKE